MLVQWGLILTVILDDGHGRRPLAEDGGTMAAAIPPASTASVMSSRRIEKSAEGTEVKRIDSGGGGGGVAVTVMLHAPKWFHRRYMVMIQNVLVNLPPNWKIQIFYNEDWFHKDVLPYHPGLERLLQQQQQQQQQENDSEIKNIQQQQQQNIIWTPIPDSVLYPDPNKRRSLIRPKVLLKSIWFWESVVAENVFMFSGNGVVCGNHHHFSGNADTQHHLLDRFLSYDYVGTPWGRHDGRGGSGETHSLRRKSAMIRILQMFDPLTLNEMEMPDYLYFTQHMMKSIGDSKNDGSASYRIADKNTTMLFGGVQVLEDPSDKTGFAVTPVPFVVSGTQASLEWSHREALLNVCPELKMIFPSLHEPGT